MFSFVDKLLPYRSIRSVIDTLYKDSGDSHSSKNAQLSDGNENNTADEKPLGDMMDDNSEKRMENDCQTSSNTSETSVSANNIWIKERSLKVDGTFHNNDDNQKHNDSFTSYQPSSYDTVGNDICIQDNIHQSEKACIRRDIARSSAIIVSKEYEILYALTPGSEGSVFVCIRHGDNSRRKVVVKSGLRTLEEEIHILKSLNHNAIVKVLHAYRLRAYACMAMPYFTCDLYTYLDNHNLSVRQALIIQKRLLDALKYLHEHGIMHRDVKCENVFLNSPDDACLGDFGAACELLDPQEIPRRYGWTGTIEINSPELLALDPYTYKTDIWSAGVILFEMLVQKGCLFGENNNGAQGQLKAIIKNLHVHPLEFPKDQNTNLCKMFYRYAISERAPYTVPLVIRRCNINVDVEYVLVKMLTFDQERRPKASEILDMYVFKNI